jgi:hypothetical protein
MVGNRGRIGPKRQQNTKRQQSGTVSRRERLQQSSSFRRCRQEPLGCPSPKGRPKRTPGWSGSGGESGRSGSKTRRDSNPGPYPDGNAYNRVRVFADVDRSPRAVRRRKAGRKGPRDGREPGENRAEAAAKREETAIRDRILTGMPPTELKPNATA